MYVYVDIDIRIDIDIYLHVTELGRAGLVENVEALSCAGPRYAILLCVAGNMSLSRINSYVLLLT